MRLVAGRLADVFRMHCCEARVASCAECPHAAAGSLWPSNTRLAAEVCLAGPVLPAQILEPGVPPGPGAVAAILAVWT